MPRNSPWDYNASLGFYTRKVGKQGSVYNCVRTDGSRWEGMLYLCVYWGDGGMNFPVYGSWRKSYDAARRELKRLKDAHVQKRIPLEDIAS